MDVADWTSVALVPSPYSVREYKEGKAEVDSDAELPTLQAVLLWIKRCYHAGLAVGVVRLCCGRTICL